MWVLLVQKEVTSSRIDDAAKSHSVDSGRL